MDLSRLAEPFPAADLEWRILQAGVKNGKPWGKCVAYVTNRAIQDRLDAVCGPENWRNRFATGPGGGVVCGLSIRVVRDNSGAEWVEKWDGAENTDIEGVKGGISNAMKRAAVQWACGRYLYDLEEGWASFEEGGPYTAKIDGQFYRWSPPKLPAWALPAAKAATTPALLDFIRDIGARCEEGTMIRIAGASRNLKAYVRENWPTIKEKHRVAAAVVEAIEESTGEVFQP